VPQASVVASTEAASSYGSSAPFVCSWQTGGWGAGWVRVAGELDIVTSPQFRRTLREAQLSVRLVVLDLRELTFIDSSGVHVILDAAADARRAGRRLLIVRGPKQVDRMLTLTGVRTQVLIFDLDPAKPALAQHLPSAASA
jgi:anti-anti-sigma factor